MLHEILEDLEKILELKFTPSMHIIKEVEKIIEKVKSKKSADEVESPVTLNGSPVSFEKNKKGNKAFIPKSSFKHETEEVK